MVAMCLTVTATISPLAMPAGASRSSRGSILLCSPCSDSHRPDHPQISSLGAIVVSSYPDEESHVEMATVLDQITTETKPTESAPRQLPSHWSTAIWEALSTAFSAPSKDDAVIDLNSTSVVDYTVVSEAPAAVGATMGSMW
jgi:hypothetical protein